MMRAHYLLLQVTLLGLSWGSSIAQSNGSCPTGVTCGQMGDPAEDFLQCVGLPSTDTGAEHLHRLRGMLQALMDVYTFMRSSARGVPILSLQGALELNLNEPLQNEALVQMWLDVEMKPLLRSVSKHFLSCLSTKRFSCSTYHMLVQELSQHFSEMDPVRQKWIYSFFMYPFLSGDGVAGCVDPEENSVDWLMKNFGAFSAMARVKDFSTLNMIFSGLEVLDLLTPEQKAELLLKPEVGGLDNGTLHLVFHSLMSGGGSGPTPTSSPGPGHNWTTPGYSYSTYDPYLPALPQPGVNQVAEVFTGVFRPISRFVHELVTFTHQRNVSEMRSATLTQFLVNWTLAELADMYRPQNSTEAPEFDVTNVHDWYQQVVIPVLRRFLPDEEALMQTNISMAFHQLFFLDHGMENETISETEDVCSLTLDQGQCGVTDVVQNMAHVLHCAARSQLTLTEDTVLRLVTGLSQRLSSLLRELSTVNLGELASEVQQMFSGSPALTQEHLTDPDFIQLWFQVKLQPLLPDVAPDLLSCLSTKNFSCPVYHAIVAELSNYTHMMDVSPMYSHRIFEHFIYPFLLHHNSSDAQCVSSANNSAHWLKNNFGFFSHFASITDFYELNPHFSGLEALALLTPQQTAQLLLLPLPTPPEKEQVVDQVFDFLLKEPSDRNFMEVLDSLVLLAAEVNTPCTVYRQIFVRLYRALPSAPPDLEPFIWGSIEDLISIAPEECVPENMTCPVTETNGTNICSHSNSSEVHFSLNTVDSLCDFTLESYACAELNNFTANHLATLMSCDLPGNSSHSRVLWKMLLTKLSPVLDPALDLLASTSMESLSWSATKILDVIGEMRVSMLTDQELRNSSMVHMWFHRRLRGFLPLASGGFLRCLSTRNISCSSYQQILQIFSQHFEDMTYKQQHVVLKDYILRFLSHPLSGPACVTFNSSIWLKDNLGPFSMFLTLKQLLQLNPDFNPLDALPLLTPEQRAELLMLTLTTFPEKDVVINKLFDFFMEAPVERNFPLFLFYLPKFVPQGILSCSAYRTLFNRLDLAMASVSLETESAIIKTKMALSPHIPHGCVIYQGECTVTNRNETELCAGVNSTALQLLMDKGQMSGRFCDFTVEEFACASLSALTAEDVVHILTCSRSSNSSGSRATWKLLLSKVPHTLDHALDLLTNMTLDPTQDAVPLILDAIREIRLDTFTMDQINHPVVVQMWFNTRLRPFLSSVSRDFLSCLTTKALNCTTYQHIVHILSMHKPQMTLSRQMFVYTHFMKVFLTRNNTEDPSCSANTNSSADWLLKNLGAFSELVSFHDVLILNPNFSAMDALPLLTVRQLAEVSATPGQLTSPAQVSMVMRHVPNPLLATFYDDFSPAIRGHQSMFPSLVRSAMLQVVFDRANLSDHSVSDPVVTDWLHKRMGPLLFSLSPAHVGPYFRIMLGRNCTIQQLGMTDLNSTISSLSEQTQKEIHNHIIQSLKGPVPLHCYGDSYNHSFYRFLESTFMGFQFPNLTSFLSLMPHSKMSQLLNSMPPSDLGDFLRRPAVVDNDAELCEIYTNYKETPVFLETENLPVDVRRPTLPCVWPMALSSSQRSEVNAWFDQRLHNYLPLLTKSLISPNATHNASCVAFRKLVAILGQYNYNAADFMRHDVFSSIRAYLTSASAPKCYNANIQDLNSTAWFAEYIGPFFIYMTLEDLLMFGSAEDLKVFTVNPLNIALLNHSSLPVNLTNYYTQLVYRQDSNFNPLLLPLLCRCVAPGPAFEQLDANQSMIVLHNLTNLCTDLDPQTAAALAKNFGDNIDASTISALGKESTGLSIGQIKNIKANDLVKALSTLREVNGWNQGQARAIVQSLVSAMELNNASSLVLLGSLVVGIPSTMFSNIKGSELLTASKKPSFVQHIMSASGVVQHVFVAQIISLNSSSEAILGNVPDEMASEIPRVLLVSMSSSPNMIKEVNKKKWKRQQVELFFSVIAVENATATLGSPDDLSSSVLQGFTCTSVRSMGKGHINKLVKACHRRGKDKVKLVETQLTCMYYHIKNNSDATVFDLYPPDVLLYYDYSLVPKTSCRSYFEQLSDADFSVFSSALSYKRSELFNNSRSCLGITNTSLTKDNILVLGNMCCYLDSSYIENSDPSILEKLKSCTDLTEAQAAAAQSLLLSGKTPYGAPSTWNTQTLKDLGMLPLHLTSSFYDNFDKETKQDFLRDFLKVLKANGVSRSMRKTLKKEIRQSVKTKTKRSVDCTVGEINQVTISDETFPFNYDLTQFNSCLSADTVRDNLDAITVKVDEDDYLRVVLVRLHEAYAAKTPPNIPEDQVQLLGPASRVAKAEDITKWIITTIDTLSALLAPADGQSEPTLAKAIITRYLAAGGNSLNSATLNAIGGENLCSLDVDVLKNITQQSLKEADALDVSKCTLKKKEALFNIASQAFTSNTRSAVSVTSYQLLKPYLGGASESSVKSLVSSNVNMDMETFTSLNQDVIQSLSVSDVQGLLGDNLGGLKSYDQEPVVQNWIRAQYQTDLDTLNLGLTGGKTASTASSTAAPTASSGSTASSASSGSTASSASSGSTATGSAPANTASSTSSSNTNSTTGKPNHGLCIQAHSGLSLLSLLLLLITNQHMFV